MSFPGVGELVRNRAGRVEFVFEQQLVDALELGLAPVSSSIGDSSQPRAVAMEDVHSRTLWRHASWHYWVSLLLGTQGRVHVCLLALQTLPPWNRYEPAPPRSVAGAGRSPAGADLLRPISAALAGLQLQPQQQQQPVHTSAPAAAVQRPMSVLQSPVRVSTAAVPGTAAQNAACLQTLLGLCTQLDR